MTSLPVGNTASCSLICERGPLSFKGISTLPLTQPRLGAGLVRGRTATHSLCKKEMMLSWGKGSDGISSMKSRKMNFTIHSSSSSNSDGGEENSPNEAKKPKSFGYSRKDVILIGVGVTVLGVGLKSGLEFVGVDPLQAGNVVQLVLVLGLTIGWISTYIFRVSNKEMTYAQQLRDYEKAVMEKRLEGLTEAELTALMEQVDEEKRRLGEKVK